MELEELDTVVITLNIQVDLTSIFSKEELFFISTIDRSIVMEVINLEKELVPVSFFLKNFLEEELKKNRSSYIKRCKELYDVKKEENSNSSS